MTTEVTFYLIKQVEPIAQQQFVCELLSKIYHKQHLVYVYCKNAEITRQLNNLLWTFRDDSFIPHSLSEQLTSFPIPIELGYQQPSMEKREILLNYSETLPTFCNEFQKILDIVPPIAASKKIAKERFYYYQTQGYILKTYNLNQQVTQ